MNLEILEEQCCSTAKFLQSRFKELSDECFHLLSYVQNLDYENSSEDAEDLQDIADRLTQIDDLQGEIASILWD